MFKYTEHLAWHFRNHEIVTIDFEGLHKVSEINTVIESSMAGAQGSGL